jgi:hypothetical protein
MSDASPEPFHTRSSDDLNPTLSSVGNGSTRARSLSPRSRLTPWSKALLVAGSSDSPRSVHQAYSYLEEAKVGHQLQKPHPVDTSMPSASLDECASPDPRFVYVKGEYDWPVCSDIKPKVSKVFL